MRVDRRGFLAAALAAPFVGCAQPAAAPAAFSGTKTFHGPVRVIGRMPFGYEFLVDMNHVKHVYPEVR